VVVRIPRQIVLPKKTANQSRISSSNAGTVDKFVNKLFAKRERPASEGRGVQEDSSPTVARLNSDPRIIRYIPDGESLYRCTADGFKISLACGVRYSYYSVIARVLKQR